MQRIVGIALGYEDLNHHDQLRHDPVLAMLPSKSTLSRLELSKPNPPATPGSLPTPLSSISSLMPTRSLPQIMLDLDPTNDPVTALGELYPSTASRGNAHSFTSTRGMAVWQG